jgi:hypothetical protein
MSGGVPAGVNVTQDDRVLFSYLLGWDVTDHEKRILVGDFDQHPKMQRIAAHRASATPTPPIEGRDADVERAREALERSVTALNDWLHVYAPEFCGDDHVAESRARIGEYGTLAYIAHVQEKNRAALQALGKRP